MVSRNCCRKALSLLFQCGGTTGASAANAARRAASYTKKARRIFKVCVSIGFLLAHALQISTCALPYAPPIGHHDISTPWCYALPTAQRAAVPRVLRLPRHPPSLPRENASLQDCLGGQPHQPVIGFADALKGKCPLSALPP